MVRKIILLFSVIAGLSMNILAGNESHLSPKDVLLKYDEMVNRLSCISMRLSSRESWSPLDPNLAKYAVHETDVTVNRNGSNLDCFGTEKIFDVNGVCVVEKIICNMFIDGKHYTAYKWPVGGKPMFAQIADNNEYEEDLQQYFFDAPKYGGDIWSRVIGCDGKTIPEMLKMAQNLELSSEMADIDGISCYVLRGSTKYGKVTAWIAPERSYNAVRWTVEKSPSDIFNGYRIGDKGTGLKKFPQALCAGGILT